MEAGLSIRPLIIAMKGHPGTGKSTLAHAIATTLKFPLIDKDDIRDGTHSLSIPAGCLNDLSYQLIWRIAKTQLGLGLSVIIDSPLSSLSRLDQLRLISVSSGAQIVIIECVPRDEGKWRQRLEQRGISDDVSKSHKPTTWQDLRKLIEGYDGCYDYDVGDVPKLVVDTTADVGLQEVVSNVLRFIVAHTGAGAAGDVGQTFEKTPRRICA